MPKTARGWTTEEIEFLKENINDYTNEELCELLGRSIGPVWEKVYALGLKRDPKQTSISRSRRGRALKKAGVL